MGIGKMTLIGVGGFMGLGLVAMPFIPEMTPEQDLASLLLHLSRLASHTGNLLKTGTASLAISEPDPGKGDPQTLARVSMSGSVNAVSRAAPEYAALKDCYLSCVPTAEPLFGFEDFILFRLQPTEIRYVGGFAQAYSLDAEAFRQAVRSVDS